MSFQFYVYVKKMWRWYITRPIIMIVTPLIASVTSSLTPLSSLTPQSLSPLTPPSLSSLTPQSLSPLTPQSLSPLTPPSLSSLTSPLSSLSSLTSPLISTLTTHATFCLQYIHNLYIIGFTFGMATMTLTTISTLFYLPEQHFNVHVIKSKPTITITHTHTHTHNRNNLSFNKDPLLLDHRTT